jgi:hypothetical protein
LIGKHNNTSIGNNIFFRPRERANTFFTPRGVQNVRSVKPTWKLDNNTEEHNNEKKTREKKAGEDEFSNCTKCFKSTKCKKTTPS